MKKTVIAALFLALAVTLCGAPDTNASASEPTYDTAVVDGDYGEWNLNEDFFASMYRAGDPSKPVEADLYLRYDCQTETLYGLVKALPDVPIEVDGIEEHWVKVNNDLKVDDGDYPPDGELPDFAWVGREEGVAEGWEFSTSLPDGTFQLTVHTLSFDDQEIQTAGTEPLDLVVDCGTTAVELVKGSFTARSSEEADKPASLLVGLGIPILCLGLLAVYAYRTWSS